MSYFSSATMSALNSGTTIYQDTDVSEPQGARKTKGTDMQAKQPATKRSALGTITNQTRIQPFRAAKQASNSETLSSFDGTKVAKTFSIPQVGLQSQAFSIHVDHEETVIPPRISQVHDAQISQHRLQLRPEVTNIRTLLSTAPHQPILIEDSPIQDSPMVLDTSMGIVEERIDTPEERLERILSVSEYSEEIYNYLREAELRNRPKPGYMKKQPDITPSMRSILVDWLVEVGEEYKLQRQTIYLAVNYIDRFLSQMSVLRGKLQLVGAAAMFLAAKYEEIYPPDVGEFVYITDDTYTKKQVLRMEHLVLKVLSFDVAVPTINCFCERYIKDSGADDQTESLTMYLAEMTMIDTDPYLKYLPSIIAAASLCLANHTLEKTPWPNTMVESTGYSIMDFEQCLHDLYTTFLRAPSHPQKAIREKYKSSKFQEVSSLCPPPLVPSTSTHPAH